MVKLPVRYQEAVCSMKTSVEVQLKEIRRRVLQKARYVSRMNRAVSFAGFSQTVDAWLMNLASTGRGRKQALSAFVDASLTVVCLWMAYTLRHNQLFTDFGSTWQLFLLMPIVTVVVFSALGIYRWSIRSSNRRLYKQQGKGVSISAIALILIAFLLPPDRVTPRTLFLIYAALMVVATCATRMLWRSFFDTDRQGQPVAIYGAGDSGQQLASLLDATQKYRPVAFVDDNPEFTGSSAAGLPVLNGNDENLATNLRLLDVGMVVLAIPSLSRQAFDHKLARFASIGLPLKAMPSLQDVLSGEYSPEEIRDVSVNDILGRSEVSLDYSVIGRRVTSKNVLVTGGGGSIGSELVRQIVKLGPKRVVVLESSEENLYGISEEMNAHQATSGMHFVPCLGSVRQRETVDRLMTEYDIDTVYHAAAYKHVPIIEANPAEGVETNIFGTRTVLQSAIAHDVADFVLISTDKAVRPTNAMGATKRAAELILQAAAKESHNTRISMVRFGNVLGSSGSVVPKFKRQILAGGPVTITDRNITRYFMTIPEAAQLVLQASAIARGGDVFVLDMGAPVRILDLARTMIRLFGKTVKDVDNPHGDIEIVEQGLRPGEKMYEELFITDSHVQTSVAKVFTASEFCLESKVLEARLEKIRKLVSTAEPARISTELVALANLVDVASRTDVRRTGVPTLKAANEAEASTAQSFD